MPKKGTLPPGVQLVSHKSTGEPQCQWIKAPKEDGQLYGEQCKNVAIYATRHCKFHGGRAGKHPAMNSKGVLTTSKYNPVPKALQRKFETSIEDPDLLNLTKSIALVDSQIWQLCEDASSQDNFTGVQRKQLKSLLKEKRELVAQETSRRMNMGSLMEIGEVIQLIQFVYDSIARNVPNKDARVRISQDLRMLITERMPEVYSDPKSKDLSIDSALEQHKKGEQAAEAVLKNGKQREDVEEDVEEYEEVEEDA